MGIVDVFPVYFTTSLTVGRARGHAVKADPAPWGRAIRNLGFGRCKGSTARQRPRTLTLIPDELRQPGQASWKSQEEEIALGIVDDRRRVGDQIVALAVGIDIRERAWRQLLTMTGRYNARAIA